MLLCREKRTKHINLSTLLEPPLITKHTRQEQTRDRNKPYVVTVPFNDESPPRREIKNERHPYARKIGIPQHSVVGGGGHIKNVKAENQQGKLST